MLTKILPSEATPRPATSHVLNQPPAQETSSGPEAA